MKKSTKKTIYLVPHSHWDREWYFSCDTSNVLLHSNFVDFENDQKKNWFLDGQWSLVDDLVKWDNGRKKLITKSIKNNLISVGPLYSQPDVFNSQGETIFRNFEIGDYMAKKFGVSQLKTAYLPDTFGFSENLPQILKLSNINNFIFWRGLNQLQLDTNDFFKWEGIDGTKIKSFILRDGYYSLGGYYPYNAGKVYPQKNDPKYFLGKVENVIKRIKGDHKNLILPLGGDQAPFMYYQNEFIEKLNKCSNKYNFVITNNYDSFLSKKEIQNTYKGNLRTPITGKIHRTIASSRYDIKKAFRDAEDALYHLLEPLEVYYQALDKDYKFEEYKIETIIKPLLIAQTHDSLGACNTDSTNSFQLNRIKRIRENIDSQIDLIIKKILQTNNIKDETLSIFNPLPFKNNLFKIKTIYSKSIKELNINNKNLVIRSLSSKNISLNTKKPLYENKVAVYAKNLKPLSLTNFDVSKTVKVNGPKRENITIINNKFKIKIGNEEFILALKLIEDKGDSYDFSPGKLHKTDLKIIGSSKYELGDAKLYEIKTIINKTKCLIYAFKTENKLKTKVFIKNKLKNTRLSLIIEQKKSNIKINKSLNLAITNFVEDDFEKNWQENFKEYPAHVDINDGIIKLNNILNIFTKGTNEIYKTNKGVEMVLFRTYSHVTGKNLKWRPSTSGLSWLEKSPESQLQKQLEFDFEFTTNNTVEEYNNFKFEPYVYKVQQRNFIANKMTKFAINNIINPDKKKLDIKINNRKIFISSLRIMNNGKIALRLVNMFQKEEKLKLIINNKAKEIKFKGYEIKNIQM